MPFNRDFFHQRILHYATPILVAVETIRQITPSNGLFCDKKWYYILETTRILIAHCSLMTEDNEELLCILAHNIRNLYRLFGLDLADRTKWKNIVRSEMYFGVPKKVGEHIWLKLKDDRKLITDLSMAQYSDVEVEFIADDHGPKFLVGHCIYNLVGTKHRSWMKNMKPYNKLDDLK